MIFGILIVCNLEVAQCNFQAKLFEDITECKEETKKIELNWKSTETDISTECIIVGGEET